MAQPVPPVAVAPPPPPEVPQVAALPPTQPARTYRELYADASNNPAPDRTAGYLAGYRFTDPAGGLVPTPAALRDQTVTLSDRQPMAFLALVTGQGGALEVVILHRLLRYMDLPGDDPSGFHDNVLGLVGDILPHQYPTVEVPGTCFHLVGAAVRVPTVAAMAALLPTWEADTPLLGPYGDQEQGLETELVRPRYTQLIPGRYAAMLVHRRRVPPRQAYQELIGAMQAQNELEVCRDVVAWLRAACTARGGGGALTAVPSVVNEIYPIHLPPEVYRYVTSKVQADLPALVQGGALVGGPDGNAALVGALQALNAARGTGGGVAAVGEDGARVGREPKTVAEAYKETYPTLLRFCNVMRVDEVAPVWSRLANCLKSEQHVVLTQEFQRVCMSRGLSTELYVPVITTTLKQMVIGFQFIGHGADDLGTGCQPFMVSYAGSTNHYQALAAASVGNQLSHGDQSASLADYRTIRETEKIKFPRDVSEVTITLMRFAVLCQCLFQGVGDPHPFVERMWALALGVQNAAPFISERFHSLSRAQAVTNMYYARIVRAVQLSVFEYLQQVATNVGLGVGEVDLPVFSAMMQDLKRGTFHLSTNWVEIPEVYLDPIPTRMAGSVVPSGAATTVSMSTRSTVSSMTNDPSARPAVARIPNPNPDAEFTSIPLRPGGARAILREHPPPRNDAGTEFCVAWWTRSGCFQNCGRQASHVPFASPTERSRLLTYVRANLQAPPTSTSST